MSYVNAKDVLPDGLLRELQKHCTGLLWIPVPRTNAARDAKVRELFAQGMGIGDLATLFGMTGRRVRELVQGIRQALPGKAALPRESAESGDGLGLSSKSEGISLLPRQTDVEPRLERARCAPHVQETSRRKKRLDAKHVSLTVPPAAQGLRSHGEQSSC